MYKHDLYYTIFVHQNYQINKCHIYLLTMPGTFNLKPPIVVQRTLAQRKTINKFILFSPILGSVKKMETIFVTNKVHRIC